MGCWVFVWLDMSELGCLFFADNLFTFHPTPRASEPSHRPRTNASMFSHKLRDLFFLVIAQHINNLSGLVHGPFRVQGRAGWRPLVSAPFFFPPYSIIAEKRVNRTLQTTFICLLDDLLPYAPIRHKLIEDRVLATHPVSNFASPTAALIFWAAIETHIYHVWALQKITR
jgi:hypothetical protein